MPGSLPVMGDDLQQRTGLEEGSGEFIRSTSPPCPEQTLLQALDSALCTDSEDQSLRLRPTWSGPEAAREPPKSLGTGSSGHLGRKQLALPGNVRRASRRRHPLNLKYE